jgi:hypothetical protein
MRAQALVVVALLACTADQVERPPAAVPEEAAALAPSTTSAPAPATARHEELVALAAREYRRWRLVDDEMHWAPGLCRAQLRGYEHVSDANTAAHADKLYRLWGLDIQAYGVAVGWTEPHAPPESQTMTMSELLGRAAMPPAVRQVLVKESFEAHPFDARPFAESSLEIGTAMKDGQAYVAGDPIGLFVMLELDEPSTPTDDGWIYGVVAPDGNVVEASADGACRDCHAQRPNRLFGMQRPG